MKPPYTSKYVRWCGRTGPRGPSYPIRFNERRQAEPPVLPSILPCFGKCKWHWVANLPHLFVEEFGVAVLLDQDVELLLKGCGRPGDRDHRFAEVAGSVRKSGHIH